MSFCEALRGHVNTSFFSTYIWKDCDKLSSITYSTHAFHLHACLWWKPEHMGTYGTGRYG